MKTAVKKSLAVLLYLSGITPYLLKKRTAQQCVVLMYHRILPADRLADCPSNPSITLSRELFDKQMAYVARRFNPMSVGEMNDHLKHKRPFAPNRLLITFDDGWMDNFDFALPVLKAHQLPALVFLSTGFMDTPKSFWQERMTVLLTRAFAAPGTDLQAIQGIFSGTDVAAFAAAGRQKQRNGISRLVQSIKALEYRDIDAILEKLERSVPLSDSASEPVDFLTWQNINEMNRNGVDFGAHGVDHLILTRNAVDIDFELRQAKAEMESRLGSTVVSMSYPNGDYSQSVVDTVKAAGYDLGFGTQFGYNHHHSNPLTLKRINVNAEGSSTIPMFLGRILGLW